MKLKALYNVGQVGNLQTDCQSVGRAALAWERSPHPRGIMESINHTPSSARCTR